MSSQRFASPQDPLFQRLNSSIAFDFRLAPYDIEQSLAHVRMLGRQGIIGADDVAARSLALPFFPDMTEGQVARVAEALRAVLGQAA